MHYGAHWKDITGRGGTENKRDLIRFCKDWWPLYKLDEGARWPPNGTLDYNTLLQLMLFLRREGKWTEVSYADMFFSLRNHPEWQRDCGIRAPSDPLVLALEKENKTKRGRLKRCCSACSIGQRCTKSDKVYQSVAQEQNLADDLLKPPHTRQERDEEEDTDSEDTDTSPIAHWTGQQTHILQAPLREAIGPEGGGVLVKAPFSTIDLEAWEKVARNYRSDPVNTAKRLRYIIKQHNPDWSDMQLLLDALTETEKRLIIKTAGDLAEDYYKTQQLDVKDYFPLQNPRWDPNRSAELKKLESYQEWIAKGMERAIPKTINWSALYAIKQKPSESPSEFLEKLRDAMRRHTTLDPETEVGTQQLVSLFLGQSTGDIRRKLQKLQGTDGRNLETLLDEAWRVFSNREEEYKQGMRKLVAVVSERERGKCGQGPPRQGPPRLGRRQCVICRKYGHWKDRCPERGRGGFQEKRDREKGKVLACVKED